MLLKLVFDHFNIKKADEIKVKSLKKKRIGVKRCIKVKTFLSLLMLKKKKPH
jgi:hypothetical protein